MSLFINVKALGNACVASTGYLFVVLDQHLTWKLHVDYVLHRIRSKHIHMKPLTDYLLSQLYQSFVSPIFHYGDAVWAVTSLFNF